MRKINKIYVHCTASEWGTLSVIDGWHKERGWKGIGYHGLITNIFPTYQSFKDGPSVPEFDGLYFEGRPESEVGAHVRGANNDSLGYALIGNEAFSSKQIDRLVLLCAARCLIHKLSAVDVRGHSEFWIDQGKEPKKSCPNLMMSQIRQMIGTRMIDLKQGKGSFQSPYPLCHGEG